MIYMVGIYMIGIGVTCICAGICLHSAHVNLCVCKTVCVCHTRSQNKLR